MPPMPDVPGALKITFTWSDGVADWGSRIFCGGIVPGVSSADLHAAATDLSGTWGTHLAPITSEDFTLVKLAITDLTSPSAGYGYWTGSVPGTHTGDSLPSNVSNDIEFNTGLRYRGGRPLIHHPPGDANSLDGARQYADLNVAASTAAFADFATGLTAVNEGDFHDAVHVWLRGYKAGAVTADVTIEPVIGYQARKYVGTMRRRARKPR